MFVHFVSFMSSMIGHLIMDQAFSFTMSRDDKMVQFKMEKIYSRVHPRVHWANECCQKIGVTMKLVCNSN